MLDTDYGPSKMSFRLEGTGHSSHRRSFDIPAPLLSVKRLTFGPKEDDRENRDKLEASVRFERR